MKLKILIALSVLIAVSGCGLISKEPEMSPQEVVTKFCRWYIGYPGNPLVDREYRESPCLAESFGQEVDEALESQVRADAVLLAQDIPDRFSVDEADISGDQTALRVCLNWGGNPWPSERVVTLNRVDDHWEIMEVVSYAR